MADNPFEQVGPGQPCIECGEEYGTHSFTCPNGKRPQHADLKKEAVDHPAHYGGADNPYEAIKVIEAWDLGFCLGNCVKYVARSGKKEDALEDLRKAAWYLNREIEKMILERKEQVR